MYSTAYPYFVFTLIYTAVSDNNLTGYLVKCVNDINVLLKRIVSAKETTRRNSTDNKRLLFALIEPTIEYIMKCIFKDASEVCCAGVPCDSICLVLKFLYGRGPSVIVKNINMFSELLEIEE